MNLRARPAARRRASDIVQMPWRQLVNPFPPARLISDDAVEAIHQAALQILEGTGIRCAVPDVLDVMARAGALVDRSNGCIRLGRDIVEAQLGKARADLVMTPRNSARACRIGGNHFATAAVLGPPNCADLVRGRRSGTLADLRELLKLTQYFNIVQMNGWPVEPLDIEVRFRHLEAAHAMLTLTDKVPYVFAQSRQRIEDVLTMCAMARGETLDAFSLRPGAYTIINTNTPLQYDTPMAIGVMEMARFGQPILLTPFIMAGASTPATIASAIALMCAEVLFGLTLAQLVRPGAPVIFGCAALNIDMKTGAPAYGFADMLRCSIVGGQMARRYQLPLRLSNFSASNVPDFASGYESANAVSNAVQAGVNFLMHAAGWTEGGLCTSYEKFVLDCEVLQSVVQLMDPIEVNPDTLALDEIAEVGPGGHFFGTERTLSTVETAFYRPLISTTQNYGAWMEAGGRDAAQRASLIWQEALNTYETPHLDPTIGEALAAFVAKRRADGGAPLD
jgi:trimethylamine--corrinoid protein Co-methyltransferase